MSDVKARPDTAKATRSRDAMDAGTGRRAGNAVGPGSSKLDTVSVISARSYGKSYGSHLSIIDAN